ncbi:hypothetical protein [Sphingosinicella sp. CPCC 101087]|uniref:hypothetical protein n=1 Tax=Sphingosinicella sp. CPCC 101087 TaxID=2497754 RepID=UPI00101C1563|nr:hypothetical protein [Sphingosinicella sp. CPCC 101087]
MAYRFEGGPTPTLPDIAESPELTAEASFDPLELTVISLAEADPVASIGPPTRFTRFFERWFGIERPTPFADARLEALRRFAVLVRVTGGRLPGEEIKRFLAAGFTRFQARALQRRAAASAR